MIYASQVIKSFCFLVALNKNVVPKYIKIKEIILCEENKKDIEEIHDSYLKGLKFYFIKEMKEVIGISVTVKLESSETVAQYISLSPFRASSQHTITSFKFSL